MKLEITVSDDDCDGVYVAFDSLTTVYGAATTPIGAVREWLKEIEDDHQDLEATTDSLGLALNDELKALRRVVGTESGVPQ